MSLWTSHCAGHLSAVRACASTSFRYDPTAPRSSVRCLVVSGCQQKRLSRELRRDESNSRKRATKQTTLTWYLVAFTYNMQARVLSVGAFSICSFYFLLPPDLLLPPELQRRELRKQVPPPSASTLSAQSFLPDHLQSILIRAPHIHLRPALSATPLILNPLKRNIPRSLPTNNLARSQLLHPHLPLIKPQHPSIRLLTRIVSSTRNRHTPS